MPPSTIPSATQYCNDEPAASTSDVGAAGVPPCRVAPRLPSAFCTTKLLCTIGEFAGRE